MLLDPLALRPASPARRRFLIASSAAAAALTAPGLMPRALAAGPDKTLRILFPALVADWSPLRGGGQNYRLNSFWWAAPAYYDEAGTLHPYVFAAWEGNADATVWTFRLDPKATFSDGSPITAADVKGSWEVAAVPATKHQRIDQVIGTVQGFAEITGGKATTLAGAVVKDERTLEVRLSQSDPIFFAKLANHLVPIVKIAQVRDADGNEKREWWLPKNGVVVSGPFRPTAINLDAGELSFVANEKFFGPKPKLERVEIKTVEDSVTATALLAKGQFDVHSLIQTPTLIKDLGKDFVAGAAAPEGDFFWFNVARAPTDDIKVRRALIHAIDRDKLYQLTFPDGPETRADQLLSAVPGVDPSLKGPAFDPELAARLLKESRYGSAAALPKLSFVGIARPVHEVAAQYIAEQWRTVLGIQAVDMKPQIDSYSGPSQATVQIFRDNIGTRVADPIAYLAGAIASGSSNARNKLGGYKNAEVDALLAKGSAEPAGSAARLDYARKAQQLFTEDAVVIPWVHRNMPKMAMPWVKGLTKNMDWQVAEPWAVSVERA